MYNSTSDSIQVCANWGEKVDLLKNTRDCANGCPYIAPNEDCLVDCSSLYDWSSELYQCNYDAWNFHLTPCNTTDYKTYCSNNPWKKCYVSVEDVSCSSWSIYNETLLCGSCSSQPNGAYIEEITSCESKVSYIKCNS
jgi:hypothetical protein